MSHNYKIDLYSIDSQCFNSRNPYRFGFNGQELDNEIQGSGNSYDFGARIYNSRLGRFLSVDPMTKKLTGWSPYIYAIDNPIMLIDKGGEFPLSVHEELVRKALRIKVSIISANDIVLGTKQSADWLNIASSSMHFDNMNYKQINNNWKCINNDIKDLKEDFGWGNRNFGGYDAEKLGQVLHKTADFYAHSNYVEVYINYFKTNNNGNIPDINDIPTYEQALKDPKFVKVAEKELNTTAFDLFSSDFGKEQAHKEGKRHHNDKNGSLDKDKGRTIKSADGENEINLYEAAKGVAQKDINSKVDAVLGE